MRTLLFKMVRILSFTSRVTRWERSAAYYAAAQTQTAFVPSFTENTSYGTGATANAVNAYDATATRTELGAWADARLWWGNPFGALLRGRAAWVHEYDRDATVSAQLATLPGYGFLVNGARLPADAALLTGIIEVPITPNLTISGKFDGEFGDGATAWAGTGKLRWVW